MAISRGWLFVTDGVSPGSRLKDMARVWPQRSAPQVCRMPSVACRLEQRFQGDVLVHTRRSGHTPTHTPSLVVQAHAGLSGVPQLSRIRASRLGLTGFLA